MVPSSNSASFITKLVSIENETHRILFRNVRNLCDFRIPDLRVLPLYNAVRFDRIKANLGTVFLFDRLSD